MREIVLRMNHAGGSNIKWINTVIPRTTVTASNADFIIVLSLDTNQGPIPVKMIKPIKMEKTKMRGNHALRSEVDGIIVLQTAKIR